MYAEISAALISLKTLGDLVKSANSLSNYGEMLAAVNTVQERLSQALLANVEALEKSVKLQARVTELENDLAAAQDWAGTARDYRLQAVGVEGKHFAQIYRPQGASTQPKHWACVPCFQNKKLSILSASDRYTYQCSVCKTVITPIERGSGLSPIVAAYEGEWAPR